MDFTQAVFIFAVIFSVCNSNPLKSKAVTCGYENCPKPDDKKINIHLVPHSHDDVCWLQTFDGYYEGVDGHPASSYEKAGVQYVLDSTLQSLKANPNRRYIQVETSYLWKWWQLQSESTRKDYVDLVNSGQIEIINGGWSMNDEAAAHYHSIIDQFTWGFRKLSDMIGTCAIPKIGWQIDPFGHSREHASISKQLGFDGMIIGRIDFRDKKTRIANKSLDFSWKTSANLDDSELFTSMFPDFYVSVRGFCFDITCSDSINDGNLESKVKSFADVMTTYRDYYQTNNILIPMGGDFHFQTAEQNFENIDKLIAGFENHPDYNVFYSSPSCYVKSVKDRLEENSLELREKTDDFFPYASGAHEFWTGYFTSRSTSKRFERVGNNILQSSKQLASFSKSLGAENADDSIESLRSAMGVMQHHDAITGTEKQKVADDYARILSEAIAQAEAGIGRAISDILKKSETGSDLDLKMCLLSNVSVCQTSGSDKFVVAAYNPLGKTVSHYVRLPVQDAQYLVNGPDGEEVVDVMDPIATFDHIPEDKLPKELVFKAKDLPPLGLKLYVVEKLANSKSNMVFVKDEDHTFGTETNGFTIDPSTNLLSSVTINGLTVDVTQELLYYEANTGIGGKPSGAYVFRPSDQNTRQFTTTAPELRSQRGELVDEVRQEIAENVIQIIRAYKGDEDDYVEFDWLVGDLERNREVITRFNVKDFSNGGVFYTDSNGREQIRRVLNERGDYEYDASEEPVTGNYYPVTARISLEDEGRNLQVAVLNDRAQGGSCLRDGEIELMVHRRLTRDDGYGVSEALNEQQYDRGLFARGRHYLNLGPIKAATGNDKSVPSTSVKERKLAHEKLLAPTILLGELPSDQTFEDFANHFDLQFAGLQVDLPENVHILTLEPWSEDGYLLRFEHFVEKGEDEVLSKPAVVDLAKLFRLFEIVDITETYLGANPDLTQNSNRIADTLEVTLNPMQIRTFVIKVNSHYNPIAKSIPYNVNQLVGIDLI